MESDSVIYGLLGRIHLLMRRVCNRITDVEYMRINKDYAREIVRLAAASGNGELVDLAGRLRLAMELDQPDPGKSAEAAPAAGRGLLERLRTPRAEAASPDDRYVRSLR